MPVLEQGDRKHVQKCLNPTQPSNMQVYKYASFRVAFVESRYCLTVQSACLRLCLSSSCLILKQLSHTQAAVSYSSSCLVLKQHAVHPRCAAQDCCTPPTSPSNFHHRGGHRGSVVWTMGVRQDRILQPIDQDAEEFCNL